MFKRTKRRIVMTIMLVSVALLVTMMCVIYVISYSEMYESNQDMLKHYIENADEGWNPEPFFDKEPENEIPDKNEIEGFDGPDIKFQLSTFYAVEYDPDKNVLHIDNNDGIIYSESEILAYAEQILQKNDEAGIYKQFSYRMSVREDEILVVFLDNTIESENFIIVLKYSLLFGGITLVVIFLLSCFWANIIVKPLEESATKQKQFISDAGHELKTPIAVIMTNLEMLNREIGENKWVDNVVYEAERMAALVKQLMELAKTERMLTVMEELDLSHLMEGEILPFESVAFEQGILLNYENIDSGLKVQGNAEQLRQLVAILLDNAIRYSEKNSEVKITLREQKGKVILAVANRGEMIPKEKQEHLFDRFYRGDYARSDVGNHYGLGLAIARAIVEGHRGKIGVACENEEVIFEVQLSAK